MAYRSLTIKRKVNAPLCRPISVQSYTGRNRRDPTTTLVSVYAGRKRMFPSDSESRPCFKNSSMFLNSYISILCCPVFRRARFPSQALPRAPFYSVPAARIIPRCKSPSGPARITLQHFTRGTRVPSGQPLRHLQDPTLHYAFPHTCSCHQHVTAWTPTRHSCADYIDDTWSVTSAATQLKHRCPSASRRRKYLKPAWSSGKQSTFCYIQSLPSERFRNYEDWHQTTHIAT